MDVILNNVNPIMASIRIVFVMLDYCVYFLLRVVIDVFFNIATYNFIDREMIFNLFSRVQLIIGIFMVFQLTMTIIKGIVNPDSFTDAKTGFGNVVMRIIVSLALLALIVPLNISSPKNEYETQINNNGVLFGTLYSLQSRILKNNTIGRLILGDSEANYTSSDDGSKEGLGTFADRFMNVIVKTFYQLNVDEDGNYVCDDGFDEEYNDADISPFAIIWHGVEPCGYSGAAFVSTYQLSMSYLISTIGVGILVVLFFMMTFNVAKRVFQLAALQLMAPIPIISYMDPKGSKDSAFNAWLKLLGTTYLELFIQLAVIYFAIGVINSFLDKFGDFYLTTTVNTATGDTGTFVIGMLTVNPVGLSFFVMTIALFIFAKDAPKFFKQMLGVKDDGKGFFSAFGTAMGFGAAALSTVGSFQAGRSASRMADIQNHDEAYANRFGNRAKHLLAGIVGAGKGIAAGSAAASESKGNGIAKTMAAWKAMDQISESAMQNGVTGSTFVGRSLARGSKMFQGAGNTDFDKETRAIAQLKSINKSGEDLFNYLNGKGKTDGAGYMVTTADIERRDADGVLIGKIKVNDALNEFNKRKAAALAKEQQSGGTIAADFNVTVVGADGTTSTLTLNAHDAVVTKIEEELGYAAGQKWAQQQDALQHQYELDIAAGMTADEISAAGHKEGDLGYLQKARTYNEAVKDADFKDEAPELADTYSTSGDPHTVNVSNLKKRFKKAGGMATRHESDANYKRQQADFGAIKKNGG